MKLLLLAADAADAAVATESTIALAVVSADGTNAAFEDCTNAGLAAATGKYW